jgi:hypothetical protein
MQSLRACRMDRARSWSSGRAVYARAQLAECIQTLSVGRSLPAPCSRKAADPGWQASAPQRSADRRDGFDVRDGLCRHVPALLGYGASGPESIKFFYRNGDFSWSYTIVCSSRFTPARREVSRCQQAPETQSPGAAGPHHCPARAGMTRSGSRLRCWPRSRRRTSLTGRPWRTWSTAATAALAMRGRGQKARPAPSQVRFPPLGPVLLPGPVPPVSPPPRAPPR